MAKKKQVETEQTETNQTRTYYFKHTVHAFGNTYNPKTPYELTTEQAISLRQYVICKTEYAESMGQECIPCKK